MSEEEFDEEIPEDSKSAPPDRQTAGPFDLSESTQVKPFLDFGSLRIFPQPDLRIRLDVNESTKKVLSVTLEIAESALQLQAFAAPRSSGLWHEIREQLADQIEKQGGRTTVVESDLGPQLFAELPVAEGSNTGKRPVKFVGIDGPRWFLRAMVSGKAVSDETAWAAIEKVLRSLIVVRGNNPLPPKELLPLMVPSQPLQS